MTLTIHTKEDDQRQLELKVEVSEDRVNQAMRQKARQLAGEINVPGFRRGKAPYNVVVQRFGRDYIRAEAVEDIVQVIFEEATTEAEVVPYGRPSLDEMEIEPLSMTFTIPLEPVATLGDYRSLRKEIEEVEVSDDAVEEALEQVQNRHQQIESVDRPAELGDVLTIAGKGVLAAEESTEDEEDEESVESAAGDEESDRLLFDEESLDILLDADKVFAGTSFVESLAGATAGESRAFEITFPEDFEETELAGRQATFDLTILDVKKRDVPPVDDELAKLEGDYETIEELRANLRERLEKEAVDQQKETLIEGMVDDLLEDAVLVYPPAAVEMEIDEMLQSFRGQVSQSGWEFEDYLRLQNLDEEGLREQFRESAEERVRRQLAMRQFVLDEKLRIESEDVETLIEERIGRYDNEDLRNSMRDFYLSGSGFDMISSEVLSDKVFERVVAILSGEAPDLTALDAEDQAEETYATEEE